MASDKKLNKVVKQGEIFTDFWLGVASAAVHGLSKALAASPAEEKGMIDGLVERTAEGLKDAASKVQDAAKRADEKLKELHADKPAAASKEVGSGEEWEAEERSRVAGLSRLHQQPNQRSAE